MEQVVDDQGEKLLHDAGWHRDGVVAVQEAPLLEVAPRDGAELAGVSCSADEVSNLANAVEDGVVLLGLAWELLRCRGKCLRLVGVAHERGNGNEVHWCHGLHRRRGQLLQLRACVEQPGLVGRYACAGSRWEREVAEDRESVGDAEEALLRDARRQHAEHRRRHFRCSVDFVFQTHAPVGAHRGHGRNRFTKRVVAQNRMRRRAKVETDTVALHRFRPPPPLRVLTDLKARGGLHFRCCASRCAVIQHFRAAWRSGDANRRRHLGPSGRRLLSGRGGGGLCSAWLAGR
mmetsp:Transcript_3630/g.11382  ORF Transcript_3630/g.11382 Transcript_3630/m.11382 type:complete len:289 (-) Transcript_3630:2658-3524(-)